MKGILLAGGHGSRLRPTTLATSKHLLNVYSKPMLYYSLGNLMLAGIREITVLSSVRDIGAYQSLLGDGSDLGLNLTFRVQEDANGIVGAILLTRDNLEGHPVTVALGDNLFFGAGLGNLFRQQPEVAGAKVFVQHVQNPQDYGVLEQDSSGRPIRIAEKPQRFTGNLAVTGFYIYDSSVFERASHLKPSKRGEIEVSDLNNSYLMSGDLRVVELPRGTVWMDAGTIENLMAANEYVQGVEQRTGGLIYAPEEIAWRQGFIDDLGLLRASERLGNSPYALKLQSLLG